MGILYHAIPFALVSVYLLISKDSYDENTIRNKRVLVTGASSGIGEQLAYHYSQLGARLVLTARRTNLLNQVSKRCLELGAQEVGVVPADMSEHKDRVEVIVEAKKRLGGLDHLILNHAVLRAAPWRATPENMTVLRSDMEVNFFSFAELASLALPMLMESKGHIGVVSSIAGKMGSALSSTYCASKFAIQGFFSAWRQELNYKKTNVSVTLAVLGPINTQAADNLVRSVRPGANLAYIAASPEDTAMAIVRAVELRTYELHYGFVATIMAWLHKFIPDHLESYVTHDYVSEFPL